MNYIISFIYAFIGTIILEIERKYISKTTHDIKIFKQLVKTFTILFLSSLLSFYILQYIPFITSNNSSPSVFTSEPDF